MAVDPYSYISQSAALDIDNLYKQFQENPDSIDREWRKFFEGYDFACDQGGLRTGPTLSNKEISVMKLIQAYRSRGHLIADTNPVRERRHHKADLELSYFNLSKDDLETSFEAGQEIGIGTATLAQIIDHLEKTYCASIGVECDYHGNDKLREFLHSSMEATQNIPEYSADQKKQILDNIMRSVQFESFLQTKYVGKKRFSLEGLESLMPSLDAALHQGAALGAKEFVFGMAHRGRLNVLVNIFGKDPSSVFAEFNETPPPDGVNWSGDVKYHLGRSADIETRDGHPLHLSLLANPSHLEAVNPVVQGVTFSKLHHRYQGNYSSIIPVIIHGDAAIAGQGVNYEQANMVDLDGYKVGGCIHVVLNNQVGFTANYKEGRSSTYCTDIAKVTESPVFHVNADDTEAVVHAMEMAVTLRQKFGVDVYIDILGYRRYGHNEGDEPRFTQPVLYKAIKSHPNVYEIYSGKLIGEGVVSDAEVKAADTAYKADLQAQLEQSKELTHYTDFQVFTKRWKGFKTPQAEDFDRVVDTTVSKATLDLVAKALYTVPDEHFNTFSKMKKLFAAREKLYNEEQKVDWCLAEQMAWGTLMQEGHDVRVSGQDCQRGTFAHRHAVVKDEETEDFYVPLSQVPGENNGQFYVYNSHLSEYCVLGFEYGYTLAAPRHLCIWEAQFGDFSNGAQIMIDQFISSAEIKWQRSSGLVLLLPHGFEGQGPEHSSARLERYLQLCAQRNMMVVNPTTAANFFHLMRRQLLVDYRVPLIVMTPKSLLRNPKVYSDISELTDGQFQPVIDDARVPAKKAKRVVLCSGKIYYELLEAAEAAGDTQTAILRLEQLYPLPQGALEQVRKRYQGAKQWIWAQEEPANMGAWTYILSHLPHWGWQRVSRPESASPAVGNAVIHEKERQDILNAIFRKEK